MNSDATGTDVEPTAGSALEIVNPPELFDPTPLGYSTIVVAPAGGHVAYISGQTGQVRDGSFPDGFAAQVEQAYSNLRVALHSVGAEPGQVAKVTVYVVDRCLPQLGALVEHAGKLFGHTLPAQSLVPVPALAAEGMLFEVEATVILP